MAGLDLLPGAVRKRRLLAKDGALTKVAELLPVSNMVAALLHASAGNMDEATRAMDLLQNWQDIGSPDGALTKLAEVFPGTDLVAFALHLRSGCFARALRAVTAEQTITVKVACASLLLDCSPFRSSTFLDISVTGLQVGPTRRSVAGALVDFLEDYLDTAGDGSWSRSSSERSIGSGGPEEAASSCSARAAAEPAASPGGSCSSAGSSPGGATAWLGRERLGSLRRAAVERLEGLLSAAPAAAAGALPRPLRTALASASARLAHVRRSAGLAAWLLPEAAPEPSVALEAELVDCVAQALRGLSVLHHDALPMVEPVAVQAGPPAAGAGSVVLLVLFLAMLLLFGRLRAALLLCTVAAALKAAAPGRRLATFSARLAARLTVRNAGAWSEVTRPEARCAYGGCVRGGMAYGLGRGPASPAWLVAPPGLTVEAPAEVVERLAELARKYLLDEFLPHGLLARLLEPLLRLLVQCLLPGLASVPVVLPVRINEQTINESKVPRWPFQGKALQVPGLSLAVLLEVSLAPTGPYVLRARVLVLDSALAKITRALAAQASELDLRLCSRRLEDFPREVKCRFGLGLRWPEPHRLSIELRGLASTLSLPS